MPYSIGFLFLLETLLALQHARHTHGGAVHVDLLLVTDANNYTVNFNPFGAVFIRQHLVASTTDPRRSKVIFWVEI
jgi:hypothetical protein